LVFTPERAAEQNSKNHMGIRSGCTSCHASIAIAIHSAGHKQSTTLGNDCNHQIYLHTQKKYVFLPPLLFSRFFRVKIIPNTIATYLKTLFIIDYFAAAAMHHRQNVYPLHLAS
jgi:hypothetical protein